MYKIHIYIQLKYICIHTYKLIYIYLAIYTYSHIETT